MDIVLEKNTCIEWLIGQSNTNLNLLYEPTVTQGGWLGGHNFSLENSTK